MSRKLAAGHQEGEGAQLTRPRPITGVLMPEGPTYTCILLTPLREGRCLHHESLLIKSLVINQSNWKEVISAKVGEHDKHHLAVYYPPCPPSQKVESDLKVLSRRHFHTHAQNENSKAEEQNNVNKGSVKLWHFHSSFQILHFA